jgi:uncharacterized membrane protein YkoI
MAAQATAPKGSAATTAPAPHKVDLSKYPAAVRATIERETANATIKNVAKEVEKGKTQYEVETIVDGKTRDLIIDPAGKVVVVEEALSLDAAPAAVQEALKKRGKVLKLENVQQNGRTSYEAQVQGKDGKKTSVELDAQGHPNKG